LWSAVANGGVDFLASDHAPWRPDEKEPGMDDFWAAPNGLQSLQLMTILTLEAWEQRGLPVGLWVAMTSASPARWLGLYPRKGVIAPGADADLVIYRRGEPRAIQASDLFDRHQWTPFEGLETRYRVVGTLLRGRWVYREATFAGAPFGRFVPVASRAGENVPVPEDVDARR
jgi:dihydroorotase-like cyclic amidohydrolase